MFRLLSKEGRRKGSQANTEHPQVEAPMEIPPLDSASALDTAIRGLRQSGIVVIRRAIDPARIEGLLAAAQEYHRDIRDRVANGRGFEDIDERLNFNEPTYAADLVALDPGTSAAPSVDRIADTTMFKAIDGGPLADLFERVFSIYAAWSMARVRVVLPEGDDPKRTGALLFHQEKTVTRFAGLHNLWTPLTEGSVVTNRDTPGIQFYIGDRTKLCNLGSNEAIEEATQKRLKELSKHVADSEYRDDEGFLYRPHLELGDVILFDRHVPHASYLPANASASRISFDIRMFPRPFDRGPKDFPLNQH